MLQQLEQIRDQQKETWNKFSAGWKNWDHFVMHFLKPMGDEIIAEIKPAPGEFILDIASGTGEPGLTIATLVGNGKVIISDIADKMLDVAREHITEHQLSNAETMVCDACELPFADNSFDAISCRMGFMFFPDMELAAKEMVRVLKPGGRIATAVWNVPERNPWVTIMMSAINRQMQLPAPPPGVPGMFRCAKPGLIAGLFSSSGLHHVTERAVDGEIQFDSPEMFWNLHTEVAAPVVAALNKADEEMIASIKAEVFQSLHEKYPGDHPAPHYSSLIIYGEK